MLCTSVQVPNARNHSKLTRH